VADGTRSVPATFLLPVTSMPIFEATLNLMREPAEVFAWFTQPALVIRPRTPPELSLRLEETPEKLFLGARTVIVGRRWGLSHRSVLEVTAFEPDRLLIEEQRSGAVPPAGAPVICSRR